MNDSTFAICQRNSLDTPIGSIGILFNNQSRNHSFMGNNDAEIGYWLGVPFLGKGIIPEALSRIVTYCFEECDVENSWCGYFEGNSQSLRVQNKLNFEYVISEPSKIYSIFRRIQRNTFFSNFEKKLEK
ncbi:MAG: GNAT family N-acetyltransferase [Streptococcaceae bacterium]|jgi:RimJ/RimL family protein N-acetyltransferase|nr:GNAT family N-acetyltransferase [Streptococcaceae bacterium]